LTEPWSTPSARRDLRRLDPPVRRRIVEALDRFVADPFAADIRKLSALEWRLRVGDWRVRFSFDDEQRDCRPARTAARPCLPRLSPGPGNRRGATGENGLPLVC
jgi:mRNA interferase RelE/StbE